MLSHRICSVKYNLQNAWHTVGLNFSIFCFLARDTLLTLDSLWVG